MEYSIDLSPHASQFLNKLDASSLQRITTKLDWYSEHFEECPPEPLTGKLKGLYRFRIGDYRIVYSLDRVNKQIIVLSVGHRSEIYRPK